jgi:hypothetical protein
MGSDLRARRGLRALTVTAMTVATLTCASSGIAFATSPTTAQRAQQGAQWLANQITRNGGLLQNFGKPDPVDTAYAVIGMRAAGVDKTASDEAVASLKTRLGTDLQTGGHASPGGLAEYIMAAVADGQDPRHFGGTAAPNNLVARLLATARTGGPDKGLFGLSDPTFDGAFRQGLALEALKAANVPASDVRVSAAISWLITQQCANGMWEAYRARPATACAAADPKTFTGPDTNDTSQAVQGLAAWGKFPHATSVLNSLKTSQSHDGGFPFVAAKNQPSDPDSTALVIQTLLAEHSAPTSSMWKKGTNTPYTALASFQLGCTSPDFGAFTFPGSSAANVFATVQSVPAMAAKKLPVASSAASVTVALTSC